MSRTRIRVVILGLVAAIAASLGASQGAMAQSGPTNPPTKGPGIPGKMNSTTKAERWAAATRTADRRAAKLRFSTTSKGK